MRYESERLPMEVAVLLSVLLHALLFATWQNRAAVLRLPALQPLVTLLTPPAAPVQQRIATPILTFVQTVETPESQSLAERNEPRIFVETDDSQVTGEEPQQARFYSDRATVAANPVNPTGKLGDMPYLDGTDTRIFSTMDVPLRQGATPAGPTRPALPAAPAPAPAAASVVAPPAASAESLSALPAAVTRLVEPAPDLPPLGETAQQEEQKLMAAATSVPGAIAPLAVSTAPAIAEPSQSLFAEPTPPVAAESTREIATAKSRLTAAGVSRIGVAAFNVAASPFGAYDKRIVQAVQSRWYKLIERHRLDGVGQVTLQFELMPDGRIQNLQMKENTAGVVLGLFCEKAIIESGPFEPLPESLRVLIGNQPRQVNFTFYY